jgi:formylglycine-generating enzyme required for sulfatase activity
MSTKGSTMVAVAIAAASAGCRTATQVTVQIATDLPCDEMPDTTVQVGRIGPDLEGRPAAIATRSCGAGGRIGSFVVVPSGEADDEFAVKVILGHAGRTATGCRSDETASGALPGCIFARRGLHYLPHTELTLPIVLRGDCDGIVCGDKAATCVHGACVPAVVPDPGTCRGSGCGDNVLGAADAGGTEGEGGLSDGGAPETGMPESAIPESGAAETGPSDADAALPPPDACPSGACTPPSCAIPVACGEAGDSCCESLLVTGDAFLRQNDPAYPATVSSFRLDKYETTVGRFRVFVTASSSWHPPPGSGKHTHLPGGGLYSINEVAVESGWSSTWDTKLPQAKSIWDRDLNCIGASWTPDPGPNEHRPIVCVNWYEAYAFCIWDGGFLPSYAEWNYAYVGGREQRTYPWGDTAPDPNRAQYCVVPGACMSLINVGSKTSGNGRFGQSDLAGNAWEWVLDAPPAVTGDTCNDCLLFDPRLTNGMTLGGGFDSAVVAADYISPDTIDHRDLSDGFRCARPP